MNCFSSVGLRSFDRGSSRNYLIHFDFFIIGNLHRRNIFICVLRRPIVDAQHQTNTRPFPNYLDFASLVRKIIDKWKTFASLPRSEHPSKFTLKSEHALLREITKYPRAVSQTLQASASMGNCKVRDCTNRKRLSNQRSFWRTALGKCLLSKTNMATLLEFIELQVQKRKASWSLPFDKNKC